MEVKLEKVTITNKEILYKLLQYSLYEGSMYIDNNIDDKGDFIYPWFDNYFTDNDRAAYIIKNDNNILGMVMVNENLKFLKKGKCIAEMLILPKYRRKHIATKAVYQIFDEYKVSWEVQPMENNQTAYAFWKNTIKNYTNGNYQIKNDSIEDVFIFESRLK